MYYPQSNNDEMLGDWLVTTCLETIAKEMNRRRTPTKVISRLRVSALTCCGGPG